MAKKTNPLVVSEDEAIATARDVALKLYSSEISVESSNVKDAKLNVGILAEEIVGRLKTLKSAALAGDAGAYHTMFFTAKYICAVLEQVAVINPVEQITLAQMTEEWPVLLSFHGPSRKKTLDYVAKLPLAHGLARRPQKGKKSSFSLNSVAHFLIASEFRYLRLMDPGRYDLKKDVTRQDLEAWFRDMWENFQKRPGFFENPAIRQLGLSNAESKKTISRAGTRSYEANVRDGIKRRLREAFFQQFSPKK